MKRIAWLLLFASSLAFAQTVPHVTQPFNYLWDYPTANQNGTPGVLQIAHFELQIDSQTPVTILTGINNVASPVVGFTTSTLAASPSLTLGSHTFNIIACPTVVASTVAASGCVAAVPFAFVLDPKPLPAAQRLGVGV